MIALAVTQPSFHVAGDVLNADVNEIADALRNLPLRIRTKSPDELRIDADNLSFEIYAHLSGEHRGQDFLISGEVKGETGEVRSQVHAIADRLAACAIVFNFELRSISDSSEEFVIRHQDF